MMLLRGAGLAVTSTLLAFEAHIATRAVLTPEQIAKYDVLRGYQAMVTPVR